MSKTDSDTPSRFLSRWSRLKQQSQQEETPASLPQAAPEQETLPPVDAAPAPAPNAGSAPADEADTPPPSLDDVEHLTFDSDYQAFLKPAVDPEVKNAAMKKLFFSDPHFNTMDGLDIYIEDYNATHQPLPLSIIKQLASSKVLALFDDEEEASQGARLAHEATPPSSSTVGLVPAGDAASGTPTERKQPDSSTDEQD